MASVLALENLYDAVCARFLAEGPFLLPSLPPGDPTPANTPVPNLFGWRFVAQHHTGSRIVWVPGNPLGVAGRYGPPRNPGGEPRSLFTVFEQFYVVISSNDPAAPEDERKNYHATRMLHDYWARAVYLAAHGVLTLESPEWITDKLERRFGTALRVLGTIQATVPDEGPDGPPYVDAPADTKAEIDVTELDNTEHLTVELDP
jgi:hypothetical protein